MPCCFSITIPPGLLFIHQHMVISTIAIIANRDQISTYILQVTGNHPTSTGLEQEVQAEGGVKVEDLPECPDHQPSSFLKGKPQSILSLLCFLNINLSPFMLMHEVLGVDWNHLLHILSLSRQIYLESYVGLGLNVCLAMLSLVEVE